MSKKAELKRDLNVVRMHGGASRALSCGHRATTESVLTAAVSSRRHANERRPIKTSLKNT